MAGRGLDLSGTRARRDKPEAEETTTETPRRTRPAVPPPKERRRTLIDDDEDEVDDDDEEILSEVSNGGESKSKILFIAAGALVVVIIIAVFILFGSKKKNQEEDLPLDEPLVSEAQEPELKEPEPSSEPEDDLTGIGTQNFAGDTNMQTSAVLTNPDEYIQDINGLTTRVDYTVKSITNISDFVSYEKHRGTWGGGLELYWLEAEYKGARYVVQVPFKYYKELDDVGIVPVKMEILSIPGSVDGEMLHVISYMTLDEKVLTDVLKKQN